MPHKPTLRELYARRDRNNAHLAKIAKRHGKTVIAFSGSVTEDAVACNGKGIDAFFPILRSVVTLQDAMDHDNAAHNMANTVEQVFRLIRAFRK